MLRLYLRFYLALVASLLLFVLATAALWHFTGGRRSKPASRSAGSFKMCCRRPSRLPAEQQEALRRLAAGLNGDVTSLTAVEPHWPPSGIHCRRPTCATAGDGVCALEHDSVSYVHLADGRWLAAGVPIAFGHMRLVFHVVLTAARGADRSCCLSDRAPAQPAIGAAAAGGRIARRRRFYRARRCRRPR